MLRALLYLLDTEVSRCTTSELTGAIYVWICDFGRSNRISKLSLIIPFRPHLGSRTSNVSMLDMGNHDRAAALVGSLARHEVQLGDRTKTESEIDGNGADASWLVGSNRLRADFHDNRIISEREVCRCLLRVSGRLERECEIRMVYRAQSAKKKKKSAIINVCLEGGMSFVPPYPLPSSSVSETYNVG